MKIVAPCSSPFMALKFKAYKSWKYIPFIESNIPGFNSFKSKFIEVEVLVFCKVISCLAPIPIAKYKVILYSLITKLSVMLFNLSLKKSTIPYLDISVNPSLDNLITEFLLWSVKYFLKPNTPKLSGLVLIPYLPK